MKLLPPPLDLSLAGFSTHDLFGHAPLAAGLTNLVSISQDPLVLALDGQWGAGKTTFLAMWADALKAQGFPVISFDAFANDYVDDPFLAIAGEIIALADRLAPDDPKHQELIEKTKAAGKVVLKHSVGAALKIVTLGALDSTKFSDDVLDAITDAIKDAGDDILDEFLTKHEAHKEVLQRFREALTQLPARLKTPKNGERQKPLIFIIDELDRCRPVFALSMLERIKHFFAVENVHFVLGVNQAQLHNSISAAYGTGVDGRVYLQKFIHFTFHLSPGKGDIARDNLAKFVDFLLDRLDIPQELRRPAILAAEPIKTVAQSQNLNLRAIERMVMTLALAIAFLGDRDLPPDVLGGLCVLKVQAPDLFEKAKRGALRYEEIRELFNFPTNNFTEPGTKIQTAWVWAVCTGGPHDGNISIAVQRELSFIKQRADTLIPWLANEVVDRLH